MATVASAAVTAGLFSATATASQQTVPLTFAGDNCAAAADATSRLPASARLAAIRGTLIGRAVGGTKADQYPHEALARVVGADIRGRTLTVTLVADPATCLGSAIPGEPVDAPWTAALDVDVSWIVPDARWAQRQTRSLALGGLEAGFADELRTRCRRTGDARFRCEFWSFAGDSVVIGRGRLALGRDDEAPRYRFRVAHVDEYCLSVLRRPLRACRRTTTWHG